MAASSARKHSVAEDDNVGWTIFAGVLVLLAGAFNFVDGLVAVTNANYYDRVVDGGGDLPVTDSIQTWGWVVLAAGVLMCLAAFSIFKGVTWGRIVGITFAGVNMILQFAYLAHYPLWSLTMIGLDVLVIYALAVKVRPPA